MFTCGEQQQTADRRVGRNGSAVELTAASSSSSSLRNLSYRFILPVPLYVRTAVVVVGARFSTATCNIQAVTTQESSRNRRG